jgi:C1A family cysteine protease
MSPIKNQGSCGSCWAFAVIAILEYISKRDGKGFIFSEQSLVDCDFSNGG